MNEESANAVTDNTDKNLEEVKRIARGRWVWRLIAVLFFIPSLFFMFRAENRIKEALESGDVEKARSAVSTMRIAALVGLPIGILLIALRFLSDY